jgi:hypothetical protein
LPGIAVLSPYPIGFEETSTSYFKIYYHVFCSAKAKAVNGKANLRWLERIQFNVGELPYIGR